MSPASAGKQRQRTEHKLGTARRFDGNRVGLFGADRIVGCRPFLALFFFFGVNKVANVKHKKRKGRENVNVSGARVGRAEQERLAAAICGDTSPSDCCLVLFYTSPSDLKLRSAHPVNPGGLFHLRRPFKGKHSAGAAHHSARNARHNWEERGGGVKVCQNLADRPLSL